MRQRRLRPPAGVPEQDGGEHEPEGADHRQHGELVEVDDGHAAEVNFSIRICIALVLVIRD